MNQFTELMAVSVVRADGGVSIARLPVRASAQCYDAATAAALGFELKGGVWEREVTDQHIEDVLAKAGLSNNQGWRRIAESDLPDHGPDRMFRNAMRDDGKALAHDMDAAREITRDEIRSKRDFAPLDAQIAKYGAKAATGTLTDEEKSEIATVEAERQKLRDAPADPAIDAASDIVALAAILEG